MVLDLPFYIHQVKEFNEKFSLPLNNTKSVFVEQPSNEKTISLARYPVKNVIFKNTKAPTSVGANVSTILGHFQKRLTAFYTYFLVFCMNKNGPTHSK